MSDWRDDRRELNRFARWGVAWWLIIILILAALGAGGWGLSVLLSGPRGVGDAIIQKNSAANWTAAQARFEEYHEDILATDRKIDVAKTALAADPDDPTLQANYTGTVNYCISVVGEYNAEARKFLAADFRAADLPDRIDDRDPLTDCKENQ